MRYPILVEEHADNVLDRGMPVPTTLQAAQKLRGYKGWIVGFIDLL